MRYDWKSIRADFEAGLSGEEVTKRYGVALSSLQRHLKKEGWTKKAEESASLREEEGAAERKKKPCPSASGRKEVMRLHREEWNKQRALSERAVEEEDAELAKLAKLSAEILKIRQEGERRAWGISDKNEAEAGGTLVLTWRK